MKTLFIAYNQAYGDEIVGILDQHGQRGFTSWSEIGGRGSKTGEPHLGSHAWPVMNHAILTVVEDDRVDGLLAALRAADEAAPDLGLRAYVWNVEKYY